MHITDKSKNKRLGKKSSWGRKPCAFRRLVYVNRARCMGPLHASGCGSENRGLRDQLVCCTHIVACAMRATCVGELSIGKEHFPRGIITNTKGGETKPGKGVGGNVIHRSSRVRRQNLTSTYAARCSSAERSREIDFTRELKKIF